MEFWVLPFMCYTIFISRFADANHFRGGTISWKHIGNNTVKFNFKLGWAYGRGPGCTSNKTGQLVTGMAKDSWYCVNGCGQANVMLSDVNYICTAASISEDYEQGEREFTYHFPGNGPFTVSFTGGAWIILSDGKGGSWNISTSINLGVRNDTKNTNNSPLTVSKPVYIVQYMCMETLSIPVRDIDGDDVRCRWANSYECGGICNGVPLGVLDSAACSITFPANHTMNGWFGVAITVEDFPKTTITLGGITYTPSQALSSVPLQFLISTKSLTGPCNDRPMFVSPTPVKDGLTIVPAGQTVTLRIYAHSNHGITSINMVTPAGVRQSALRYDNMGRTGVHYIVVTWTPTVSQQGPRIICAQADDNRGKTSDSRCFTIIAWDIDPCNSSPCENSGTCTRNGYTSNFRCTCKAGFTGTLCEKDINECASNPCQNRATCHDHVNGYTCTCLSGYTSSQCEIDIDECASDPCENNATCNDNVNGYTCLCSLGFFGINCETEIDECASQPCMNGATCNDHVNKYTCACQTGYTGINCEIDIDECANQPCKNDATCNDHVNAYTCACQPGYTGIMCETYINECLSEPCGVLYKCIDDVNGYQCRIISSELAAVVLTSVLTSSALVLYLIRRKWLKSKENEWWSHVFISAKPDMQSKPVFTTSLSSSQI